MDTLPTFKNIDDFTGHVWHSKAEDLLGALPDESIDLIVTSPPYDDLRTYKGFNWDFYQIAKESYRVLKPGGVLVWVVSDAVVKGSETLTSFRQALYFTDECNFRMHDTMIYQKDGVTYPESTRYYPCFEYMFVLSKDAPKTVTLLRERANKAANTSMSGKTERKRNGDVIKSHGNVAGKIHNEYGVLMNVWLIGSGFMKSTPDENAYEHPAIFPEELARRHILTWSNAGDIVLDYFSGSGTTAKIARKLDRQFIACDISSEYCELARRRLANTDPYQDSVLPNGEKQLSLFASTEGEAL